MTKGSHTPVMCKNLPYKGRGIGTESVAPSTTCLPSDERGRGLVGPAWAKCKANENRLIAKKCMIEAAAQEGYGILICHRQLAV